MSNYNYSFNPNAFEILFSTPNDPNSRRNLVPCGLGYTYKYPSPIKPVPVNEVTLFQSGYNYKPELDAMCFEEIKSNGKPKITPIIRGYSVNGVIWSYEVNEDDVKYVIVWYIVNNRNHIAVIPYEAYRSEKIYKFFSHAIRITGCPKSLFNDYLVYAIKTFPKQKYLKSFSNQGWNEVEGRRVNFAINPNCDEIFLNILPESVLRRDYHPMTGDASCVTNNFISLYSSHSNLKLLCLWRIASLLLYFFDKENIIPKQ